MNVAQSNASDKPDPSYQVRVRSVDILPYPDRRRLRMQLVLTPFKEPPDIEILILDPAGEEVASSSIIQPTQNVLEPTLHLRRPSIGGQYTLSVLIRDRESEAEFREEKTFPIPGSSNATRA